nr:GNAT family N-acetyltransferase [Thalassomonas sp. RHCl1]
MLEGYRISTKLEEMDLSFIHGFLTESPWAKGISREAVEEAIKHSLCFAVFTDDGEQIGFGRAISDYTTFAFLGDGFIKEEHRGTGLSKWVMQEMTNHPKLQGVRRSLIATVEAHGLYEKFGFKAIAKPEYLIEKWNWQAYKQS